MSINEIIKILKEKIEYQESDIAEYCEHELVAALKETVKILKSLSSEDSAQ